MTNFMNMNIYLAKKVSVRERQPQSWKVQGGGSRNEKSGCRSSPYNKA